MNTTTTRKTVLAASAAGLLASAGLGAGLASADPIAERPGLTNGLQFAEGDDATGQDDAGDNADDDGNGDNGGHNPPGYDPHDPDTHNNGGQGCEYDHPRNCYRKHHDRDKHRHDKNRHHKRDHHKHYKHDHHKVTVEEHVVVKQDANQDRARFITGSPDSGFGDIALGAGVLSLLAGGGAAAAYTVRGRRR